MINGGMVSAAHLIPRYVVPQITQTATSAAQRPGVTRFAVSNRAAAIQSRRSGLAVFGSLNS